MSSPYRDAPPQDEEPLPSFAQTPDPVGLLVFVVLMAGVPLTAGLVNHSVSDALAYLYFYAPALSASALVLALRFPVGAWLDRRYARKVARGITELEAKASALP